MLTGLRRKYDPFYNPLLAHKGGEGYTGNGGERVPIAFQCPYFQSGGKGLKVECEGGRLTFQSREAYMSYVGLYCGRCPGWERCTLAQNLTREYETREKNEKREKLRQN